MADPSLADKLNATDAQPWTPPAWAVTLKAAGENAWKNSPFNLPWRAALGATDPAVVKQGGDMIDYIKGTNPADAAEAVARSNPVTELPFLAKDAMQGKLVDTLRQKVGAASQVPFDVTAGALNTLPLVSKLAEAGGAGKMIPDSARDALSGAAQTVQQAGQPAGDWLAGREVSDSSLRGSPADMSANWMRNLAGAVTPIPGAWTRPITGAIQRGVGAMTRGSQLAQDVTNAFGRTLEVLTPLSINPTPKVVATNAALGGLSGPAGEAFSFSQEVKDEQEKLTQAAAQAENQTVQGAKEAGVVKPSVPFGNASSSPDTVSPNTADAIQKENAKQVMKLAGITTGDTETDLKVAGAVVGGLLLTRYRRNIGVAVSDAVQKFAPQVARKIGGYDPRLPNEQTFQHLNVQAAQQRLDAGAGMTESLRRGLKEVSPGKAGQTAADDFADKFNEDRMQRTGAPLSHRKAIWETDGEWLDSNVRSPETWGDYKVKREQFSPKELDDYNKLLHINQELDFRNRIYKMYPTNSQPNLHVSNYGYNLYDMPSRDLRALRQQIIADNPNAMPLANTYYRLVKDGSDYAVKRGRFEPIEGVQFKQNNPHYVPPTNLPPGASLLDDRDIVKNWGRNPLATLPGGTTPTRVQTIPKGVKTFEQLGDPLPAQERYFDELFRSTEGMAVKRSWYDSMKAIAAMPTGRHARDMLGRQGPLGRDAEARTVSWRDAYGKKQNLEINDAVVRDSFKGLGNPTSLQMINGATQQMTRFAQSGMVGPMSIAHPTFFPIDSLQYQAMSGGAFSKPRGVAIGPLDKLVQKAGIKGGLPGDPTAFPASVLQGLGPNVGAVIIDRLARVFHNSVLTDGWLARNLSKPTIQAAADYMTDLYRKTGLYQMQEAGLMGPGMSGANRAMRYNLSGTGTATTGISNIAANLTGQKLPGIVKAPVELAKTGYSFVDDIMHAASSGQSVMMFRLNKDLLTDPAQKWKATSAARNLAGDPGRAGAFRNAPIEQQFVGAAPFVNPTYQALGRLFESVKRDPSRVAMGIFMTTVMPQMSATLWNASQGPEYSQYEYFGRSADQIASHIYIARPGHPPEEGWEYPVEPTFRLFKPIGMSIAGLFMGIFGNEIHKGENADMKAAMDEMLYHRDKPSFEKGTVSRSVLEQSLLPPIVPAIGGLAAMVGVKLGSYFDLGDAQQQKDNKNAGFIEGAMQDPTRGKLFGINMPAHTEEVLNAMGASGLSSLYKMLTGIEADIKGDPQRGIQPKSFMEAFDYQRQGWLQRANDTTIGQLFGTHRAVTPSQEASNFVVKRKMDTINEITNALNSSTTKELPKQFGTKQTGFEKPQGIAPRGPQDTETMAFGEDVKNLKGRLGIYEQQKQQAYQQYGSIKADTRIPMDEKRLRMEEQAYRVVDANRRQLQDILRFEAILTAKYKKPVSFDGYDRDVPFSQQQFKPRWLK